MENNNQKRKCKLCGKTIVGNNKLGICSACKKKTGDTAAIAGGVVAGVGAFAWGVSTFIQALRKK